ncbi:DsbA family protein [bacterium]|nr:DsbA family protein [bacterium]
MKLNVRAPAILIFLLAILIGLTRSENLSAVEKGIKIFNSNPVIASIDSDPVRITDIEDKKINELRHQLFELLDSQLKKEAVVRLGEKYPKYSNKPTVKIKDEQAKAFYQANNLSSRGSYEQFYPMIIQYLEQKADTEFYTSMFSDAVKDGLIVSYLESPNDFLLEVPIGTAFLRGDRNARVMVLEFSDYQCPFCAKVQPTIAELRDQFEGKVIFGYRHAPLPFHREADEAAIAAECSRDQGKFTEYHELLFKSPRNLYISDLKSYAKQVGVKDLKKFNDCLDQETYRSRLEKDQKDATEAGINGAPGFVIGSYNSKLNTVTGEIISGALPITVFINTIEKYLK